MTEWLKNHLYLLAWLFPVVMFIISRFKKVPEGKSVNRIRLAVTLLTAFGYAFLLTPNQTHMSRFVVLLFIGIGIGCIAAMDYYN